MSGSRRPSKLLELLLVQPASSETVAKQTSQQAVESHFDASLKKKRREFVRSAVETVSSDKYLNSLLNFAECEHGDAKEPLVIVTRKQVDHCEPARHVSRLKLVLTGDERYYIQVNSFLFLQATPTVNLFSSIYATFSQVTHCIATCICMYQTLLGACSQLVTSFSILCPPPSPQKLKGILLVVLIQTMERGRVSYLYAPVQEYTVEPQITDTLKSKLPK